MCRYSQNRMNSHIGSGADEDKRKLQYLFAVFAHLYFFQNSFCGSYCCYASNRKKSKYASAFF